jgi:outer membrane protein assembly factor BamB/DNA-directed RNA polymerase subunit RPC12/RpoP
MAAQEFNCPKCGAPIEYNGEDSPTIRCPYCSTSVMVPEALRPAKPLETMQFQMPSAPAAKSRPGCLVAIIALVILIIAAVSIVPIIASQQIVSSVSDSVQTVVVEMPVPAEPTSAPTAAFTPTPSFALLQASFGSKGIGAGMLNDARYMTVDGSGTVYVADYQDGRIQAFDATGKFLHGWQVGNSKTIISGMTANHQGTLFVVSDSGLVDRYEGATGKLLGQAPYANGPEFGDLAFTPDGGFVGVWYEGRWGLITSLEGHRDDLVWFDASGKTLRTVESIISGQTGDLALDTLVAVDGLGNVYALSNGEIFKFNAQGKFVTRFMAQDDAAGTNTFSYAIAVDGKGQVYAAGSQGVGIFSPDGRFIRSFQTGGSPKQIAFSEKGEFYVLSGDKVNKYTLAIQP